MKEEFDEVKCVDLLLLFEFEVASAGNSQVGTGWVGDDNIPSGEVIEYIILDMVTRRVTWQYITRPCVVSFEGE